MSDENNQTIYEAIARLEGISDQFNETLANSNGSFKKCLIEMEKQVMELNGEIQKVADLLRPLVKEEQVETNGLSTPWDEPLYVGIEDEDRCPNCEEDGEEDGWDAVRRGWRRRWMGC